MSKFSVPHGVFVKEPREFAPSPSVIAEYEDYDRAYLLARIEELERIESQLCDELAAERRYQENVLGAAEAIIGIVCRGETHFLITQKEIDARIAEATKPKRRSRKP